MKAVQVRKPGSWAELFVEEVADPVRNEGEVLVKVHASALNRADLLQRQGKYPPPAGASDILGLEAAGEILEVGANSRWRVGDRVMALLAGGGQAERVAVPEELLMPVPDNLDFIHAAAIPEVFLTAYQAIFFEGKSTLNDMILIHAGGSGVGTAAIQMAKRANMQVFVTCSAGKKQACLALGADFAIDYQTQKFDEVVLQETGNRGVDIVLDFIGAPYLEANIHSLATGGKLIQIAMMGGSNIQELNLGPILRKHLTIIGTTLRSRPLQYKEALIREFSQRFLPEIASNSIKPVIDSVFDLSEIQKAHQRMEANENIGKIILRLE